MKVISDADLQRARQLFPLPGDVEDVIMNRSQLAVAFDTSENTITKWINRGMPVIETGKKGAGYQFQPSDCYAWHKWQDAVQKQEKQRADGAARAMRQQFLNVEDSNDPLLSMTPKQIKDAADAEKARIEVGAMRRQYVHAGEMKDLIEDLFSIVRNGLETLPDFAELELSLAPDQVVKMKGRCDQVLEDVRTKIESEFGTKGGLPL